MIARDLRWEIGVATVAVVILTAIGVPFASAVPVGLLAGCLAMLVLGGHGHSPSHQRPTATREEVRDEGFQKRAGQP